MDSEANMRFWLEKAEAALGPPPWELTLNRAEPVPDSRPGRLKSGGRSGNRPSNQRFTCH
jgi:hypothetical protein